MHESAAGEVLTDHGCLRYCPTHELALTQNAYKGWHWHHLTPATVITALRWARSAGLGHRLRVQVVQCPRCAVADETTTQPP